MLGIMEMKIGTFGSSEIKIDEPCVSHFEHEIRFKDGESNEKADGTTSIRCIIYPMI
jgi:hypothetical protein